MRTNFWMGCAQVVLILFGGVLVLIAVQQMGKPENLVRLATAAYNSQQVAVQGLPPTAIVAASPSPLRQSYTASPGSMVQYNLTINNRSDANQAYRIVAQSSAGWAELAALPTSITLGPKSNAQFTLNVHLPANAADGSDDTTITVTTAAGEQNSTVLHTVSCTGCQP